MIRYSMFLFGVIGMGATAIASVAPLHGPARDASFGSVTVFQTTMADTSHKLVLQKCALEDCSDTPQ
jgi:hypothetical protein